MIVELFIFFELIALAALFLGEERKSLVFSVIALILFFALALESASIQPLTPVVSSMTINGTLANITNSTFIYRQPDFFVEGIGFNLIFGAVALIMLFSNSFKQGPGGRKDEI